MKMRASFGKVAICALAGFCIFAVAILLAIHQDQTATGTDAAQVSPNAAKPLSAAPVKTSFNVAQAYGKLPMGFEENDGQTNQQVRFLSHGAGYELFLTPQEAVLALRTSTPVDLSPNNRAVAVRQLRKQRSAAKASILRVDMPGANPAPQVSGEDRLPGRTDYFIGNDRKKWRTNVASYARVRYAGVYPGIDLVFYGNQQHLEYDYVVAPGADPSQIALEMKGAKSLHTDAQGNLVMKVAGGKVELLKPVVYQEANGQRQQIAVKYTLSAGNRVSFSLGPYDSTKALTIDPILNYSTYLGGSAVGDIAYGAAVDTLGDAYVAGVTYSTSFPTTSANAYDSTVPADIANGSVFVTELNPAGTSELYSTYLGGSGSFGDVAYGVALDPSGNVYVTGDTSSTDFPITATNAAQSTNNSTEGGTAFLTVLNPALLQSASLVYSTYLGGSTFDYGNAVAADANHIAYITGYTASTDFPTQGGYQSSQPDTNGNGSAFVSAINTVAATPATALVYSTYLGGAGDYALNYFPYGDQGFGIATDGSGNAYVAGTTTSIGFPVVNSATGLGTFPSGNTSGTVFVSEISTAVANNGTASLLYSTFLGGNNFETASAISLGPSNVAFVAGKTGSSNFPDTGGAYDSTPNASGVSFVSKITPSQAANSLTYAATVGGSGGDIAYGIQVDTTGDAYVDGATGSVDFPITPGALQSSFATGAAGTAFIFELNPSNTGAAQLVYSSFLGGSGSPPIGDTAFALALDSGDNAYIAGQTVSTNFPVYPNPGAFQTSLTGSDAASTGSAFVTKLTLQPTVTISPLIMNFNTVLIGSNATQTLMVTNNTGLAGIPFALGTITGANGADFGATPGGANPCGATLPTNNTPCTVNVTFTPSVNGAESGSLPVQYAPYGITSTQNVALSGNGTNVAVGVTPTSLTFAGQMVTTTSASQAVTVSNNGGTALAYTATLSDTTDYAAALSSGSPCTGGSIPATTSCTYNITFTPASSSANPLNATFTIAAGGANYVVNLTGAGWDFTITTSTPSVSTAPGGSPSPAPMVTVTFEGGFPGPVTLACSGTIPMGSCTAQSSVTSSGNASVTIMTAGSSAAPPVTMKTPPVSPRQLLYIGLAILSLIALPFARQRRQKLGLAGALVLMIALTACSGSAGTPAGTYPLTITGTGSGSGTGNTISHPTTITLTVT